MTDYHEELRKKLDLFPIGLPRSEETMEILHLLFDDREARIASHLPLPPLMYTASKAASKSGLRKSEAAQLLIHMAGRNVIASISILGEPRYVLLPAVPGFMEMQFMSGVDIDEKRREAGLLWHQALNGEMGEDNYGYSRSGVRVVPIRKTVDTTQTVFNYEELGDIIRASGSIAVTDCACRKSAQKCNAPLEVCMMFSTSADYLLKKGIARKITRKEAFSIFESCADAGLVPTTTNVMPPVQIICNCCSCCCASLQGVTALGKPASSVRSNFRSEPIEGAGCRLCKACVNACPVEALRIENDILLVDEDRCIGCGVCVHKCNQKALALVRKSNVRPAATSLHLAAEMYEDRGKTQRVIRNFIKDIL